MRHADPSITNDRKQYCCVTLNYRSELWIIFPDLFNSYHIKLLLFFYSYDMIWKRDTYLIHCGDYILLFDSFSFSFSNCLVKKQHVKKDIQRYFLANLVWEDISKSIGETNLKLILRQTIEVAAYSKKSKGWDV